MDTYIKEIKSEKMTFRHARGASLMSGREFHPYHEIILFMGAHAVLYSETQRTEISPNTLIVIPKETYHQLSIVGEKESYTRCVLNFYDTEELLPFIGKAMNGLSITTPGEVVLDLFGLLMRTADSGVGGREGELILGSALTLLLSELKCGTLVAESAFPIDSLVSESISYIIDNLSLDLSISGIARQLNVSESHLSHTFKKEMNIPIHKYIMKKRLAAAFEMISTGTPVTIAAEECGFCEYSNFFRQYKREFGFSPSNSRK